MTRYEIYVFCLCSVVFILFVSVFTYMLVTQLKLYFKSIDAGLEDEILKKEYEKTVSNSQFGKKIYDIISIGVGIAFSVIFIFCLALNIQESVLFGNIPTLKMVNSGSMSRQNEKNKYLIENNLDNQIQMFDLVGLYKKPKEEELKLYDVVLYEVDNTYVIHRIVDIKDSESESYKGKYFICQGDANPGPDMYPVLYDQIKAIYKGQRIPFVGSFVMFMQSPAGWLCVILVLFNTFGAPLIEKKVENKIINRLKQIDFIDEDGAIVGLEKIKSDIDQKSEPKTQ